MTFATLPPGIGENIGGDYGGGMSETAADRIERTALECEAVANRLKAVPDLMRQTVGGSRLAFDELQSRVLDADRELRTAARELRSARREGMMECKKSAEDAYQLHDMEGEGRRFTEGYNAAANDIAAAIDRLTEAQP